MSLSMRMACILGSAIASFLLAACANAPRTPAERFVDDIESGRLPYAISGGNRPTIVLQAGLGDGKQTWRDVAEGLAKRHSVFAYDRPGYGASQATEAPRDPCTIASELRSQLRAANIQPPYLLVGHSLGGLYQYVFAKMYPGEVAGIVLLDPTHPMHWQRMQDEVPVTAATVKVARSLAFSGIMRREFDAQSVCLERIDTLRPLEIPSRLLVSSRFKPMEKGDFEALVKRLRQDWQRLTRASQIEVVDGTGHYIQNDRPQAVVSAVDGLIASLGREER